MAKKKKDKTLDYSLLTILPKAEKLFLSGDSTKLLQLLKKTKPDSLKENADETRKYYRLLAFAFAYNKSINEAEKICSEKVSTDPEPLDYYFILSFLHLSLREYQQAITVSTQYLELYESSRSSQLNYTNSSNHLSQIYNFRGSAYLELTHYDAAISEFENSIAYDSGNHLPYLNLVQIAQKKQERERALEIIKDGLHQCRQIQELRLLQESISNKRTISACMIVKNEEELLPDCLLSIRDWVDEIIVVDTGSQDKTVEIAESFGARVYHQAWEGNFSKHRNYSLEQATSDWVFIIDADERMQGDDVSEILRLTSKEDVEIISINVFNVYGKQEELRTYLPSVRFWRRSKNLQYEGIVHNLLKLSGDDQVTRANVTLKHLGYDLAPEKMHKKFLRTKKLLEDQLSENPDNSFALFNYAQVLKAEGGQYPVKNIPEILKASLRAIDLTDPTKTEDKNIHLMCLDQAAWAYFYEGSYDKALEYATRALTLKPDYLDPLMLLGSIYARQKKWAEAEEAYNNYLEVQAEYDVGNEKDSLILSHIDNRVSAYYSLGLIYEAKREYEKAKQLYKKILVLNGGFLETSFRLGSLLLREKNYSQAIKYFIAQQQDSTPTVENSLGLAKAWLGEENTVEAEKAFQHAIALDQFDAASKITYCRFLLSQNRQEEVTEILTTLRDEGKSTSEITLFLGDMYYSGGNYNKAIVTYAEYLKDSSGSVDIYNNLGNCYFKIEEYIKAESCYRDALAMDSNNSISIRNLGVVLFKSGKYQEALELLDSYQALQPDDLQVVNIISQIHVLMGSYKEAVGGYEAILRKYPSDILTVFNLSECYLLMGHKDSAIIGYKRAIVLDPAFQPAINRLNELQTVFLASS